MGDLPFYLLPNVIGVCSRLNQTVYTQDKRHFFKVFDIRWLRFLFDLMDWRWHTRYSHHGELLHELRFLLIFSKSARAKQRDVGRLRARPVMRPIKTRYWCYWWPVSSYVCGFNTVWYLTVVGAELSDVSLVDFDRHLIRDFSPGETIHWYHSCIQSPYLTTAHLLCGRPNRQHYGSCPSVSRLSRMFLD